MIIYIDYCIMAAKSNTQLEEEVDELSNKLENTDEGDLDE